MPEAQPIKSCGDKWTAKPTAVLLALGAAWLVVFAIGFFAHAESDGESINDGLLATGILDGLVGPPAAYRYGHTNGPLVYGVLLAPIYALAGSKFLWIALLGSLFVAGGVLFWTLVLRDAWGPRCAAAFLLFQIFAPPFFATGSHSYFEGAHLECTFFSGLLLYLFFRQGDRLPGFAASAGFGFLGGAAVYFSLQNAPVVGALAAAALWRWRWKGLLRLIFPALFCFFLCFSPDEITHAAGSAMVARAVVRPPFLAKLGDLFARQLPAFAEYGQLLLPAAVKGAANRLLDWRFLEPIAGAGSGLTLLSYYFFGLMLCGIVLAVIRAVRRPRVALDSTAGKTLVWLLLAQIGLWLIAYGFGEHQVRPHEFRYLFPIYPALLAFLCYAIVAWPKVGQWLAAPLLLFSCVGLAERAPADLAHIPDGWRTLTGQRGDHYECLIGPLMLGPTWGADPTRAPAMIAKLPRRWREPAWLEFGANLANREPDAWLHIADRFTATPAEQAAFAFGAGKAEAKRRYAADAEDAAGFAAADKDSAAAFVAGFGYGIIETDAGHEEAHRLLACSLGVRGPGDCATTGARIAKFEHQFQQLSPPEFCAAFLGGAANRLGWEKWPRTAAKTTAFIEFWRNALGAAPFADAEAAFTRNYLDGEAKWLVDRRNDFVYRGDPAEWPLLREALLRRGVTVRASGRIEDEYEIDPQDEKKSFFRATATDAALVGNFLFGGRHWREAKDLFRFAFGRR